MKTRYLSLILLFSFWAMLFSQTTVTFRVRMNLPLRKGLFSPQDGDSLVVRGTFNNWLGNTVLLSSPPGDSLYSATVAIPGDSIEFKYVIRKNDGRDTWEQNPQPENFPYGNRKAYLSGTPLMLPAGEFNVDQYLLTPGMTFSVAELQKDFTQLRQTIEGLHPALYEFTDKASFDSLFDARHRMIMRPMTAVEFYRLVQPLAVRIGCGHSNIYLPEYWWQGQPNRFFPLQLYITRTAAYVLPTAGMPEQIAPGSRLLSINEVPAEVIVAHLLSMIPADGYNTSYRLDVLNRRFADKYAQHYGFPETFRVEWLPPGGTEKMGIDCPPVTGAKAAEGDTWLARHSLEVMESRNAAVLTVNNFANYQDPEVFEAFIDSSFALIREKKIQNLLLDLRDNNGGNPFSAAWLLSYLTSRPVPYFDHPFGHYVPLAEPLQPAENRFRGKLFVLINGRDFSTTGHLCALLKYHKIGTLVGSETGGTYTCNDAKTYIPLKNTRLMVQMAQGSFTVAVEGLPKGKGIQPDIPVKPNIEDILQGRDTVKEYILKMIEEGKGI